MRRALLWFATIALLVVATEIPAADPMAAPTASGGATSAPAAEPFLSDDDMAAVGLAAGTRSGEHKPSVSGALADMALALVVVIGLVGATSWVVKRSGARRKLLGTNSRHLELVETLPLGLKRAVSLVRLGDRVVLVGQSEQGMAALGDFTAGIIDGKTAPTQPPAPAAEASSHTAIDRLSGLIGQLITTQSTNQAQEAPIPTVDEVELVETQLEVLPEREPEPELEAQPEHATDRIARFQERLREATEGRN